MAVNELRPPHITDQPIIARMKRIGLEPGKSFDPPLLRVTGSRCPTSVAFCWTDSRGKAWPLRSSVWEAWARFAQSCS